VLILCSCIPQYSSSKYLLPQAYWFEEGSANPRKYLNFIDSPIYVPIPTFNINGKYFKLIIQKIVSKRKLFLD